MKPEVALNLKADRWGHNGVVNPCWGRITYIAHAKGYVMARRPRAVPFVITEKLWNSFPLWDEQRAASGGFSWVGMLQER
jgi:hypothetical protein